jgi:hypothetical protein
MGLFDLIFGKVEVNTITLEEIEERVRNAAKPEYYPQPAPPHAVVAQEPGKTELARAAGMMVIGTGEAAAIFDKDGFIPADEWERLNREGEEFMASLPPMKRDPVTGRPVRY